MGVPATDNCVTAGRAKYSQAILGTGSVALLQGDVQIQGAARATVTVNDSLDDIPRTVTLDTDSSSGFSRLTVIAPQRIYFRLDPGSSMDVLGGRGGNTFNVQGTLSGSTLSLSNNGGTNTLHGPDTATTWQITGSNAGNFTGGVSFTGMQNLIGGAGVDTFVFANGGSVAGRIDGGGGTNTLDYSAYTSNVLVNLQTGTATGVGGLLANIQNAKGGNGGAAGSYNILVGNGGNILTGGNGRRNLLIAGARASTLNGGNGDDILIGGTTAYDRDLASLQAIMTYWVGSDTYQTRVTNLTSGNRVPRLDATRVSSNGGGNTFIGGAGRDLFFANLARDRIVNRDPATETLIAI